MKKAIRERFDAIEARECAGEKNCVDCGFQPADQFIPGSPRCEKCRKIANLIDKFCITREEYDKLFAARKCSICGAADEKLNIDHCHRTGRVRGVLCTKCNAGLGMFRDDTERLLHAAAYLELWRKRFRDVY